MPSVYSWVGHHGRELLVHAQRATQYRVPGKRVVIFSSLSDAGADLRGIALAPELRRLGWRVTWVPKQLELDQRLRIVRAERPDVILLRQSRHPLNRPRFYGGVPCVFDADDADILDPACRDAVIECCRDSAAVIAGSRYLAKAFSPYNDRVAVVWTGTFLGQSHRVAPSAGRAPILAWAASDPHAYPHEAE